MTDDDIIRLAQEANMNVCSGDIVYTGITNLTRFHAIATAEKDKEIQQLNRTIEALMDTNARLVPKSLVEACINEEREACAKLCEEKETYGDPVQCWLDDCAASIRARGDK